MIQITFQYHISFATCIDVTAFTSVPAEVIISHLTDAKLGNNDASVFHDISRSRVAVAVGVARLDDGSVQVLPPNRVGKSEEIARQVHNMIVARIQLETLKSWFNKRSI